MPQIKLDRDQKIVVGRVMGIVTFNDVERGKFLANPSGYLSTEFAKKAPIIQAEIGRAEAIPAPDFTALTLIPHQNTETEMHITIPFRNFVMTNGPGSDPFYDYTKHPDGYNDVAPNEYLDPQAGQDIAYYFRLADYVFAQCG